MKAIFILVLIGLLHSCKESDKNSEKGSEGIDSSEAKSDPESIDSLYDLQKMPTYSVDLPKGTISEPLVGGFIDVVVNANNEIRIEGDKGPPLNPDDIKTKLEAMSEEIKEREGIEQVTLKIHADRSSNFETFAELMAIAKDLGLKIVIATK